MIMRGLRSSPGFVATAIAALAIGIGLSTTVFTVAETLLLRRLPIRDQDRVVTLWGEAPDGSFPNYPLMHADAREFVRRAQSLEQIGFFAYEGASSIPVRDGDNLTRLRQAHVSGNFFDVLGVRPALGRTLRAEDDVVGAAHVAVLSHAAWLRLFGGDASALGRKIVLHGNDAEYAIVGVMPQGLDYPRGVDYWAPMVPARTKPGTDSVNAHVNMIARLRPGVTPEMARDEVTAFYQRADASPWQRSLRGSVHSLPTLVLGDTKPAVLVFGAAAALLLLITCVNVANLLLVRGLSRAREIAVRLALGAERRDVIAQLLVENVALAVIGGAIGVLVAIGAVELFTALAPADVPRLDEMRVSGAALAGAIAITGVAVLLFGIAPAVSTSRVDLQRTLRSGSRQTTVGRGLRISEMLVAGQMALAVLVLSAAALTARSLLNLERARLAIEPSRLLIGELAFRYDQVATRQQQLALLDALLPAVAAVPGVEAVSPVVAPPFSGPGGWDGRFSVEGQSPEEAARNPMLNMDIVVPDYFRTVGMALVRGRSFTDDDREGAPMVAIVSEAAARLYWPNQDPIGKQLIGNRQLGAFTVIGVVPDSRYRDLRDARASVYMPLKQSRFPFAPMNLAIRTRGEPADVVPALRRAVREAVRGLAIASAQPFESYMLAPLAQPRLNALMLAVFSGAALTLAAIGLFGVMATMVRQRTRDLGVRMALGATAAMVRGLVLRRALAISATGLGVGLAGAFLVNRLLVALLYDVSPTDAATLGVVALILLTVGLVAALMPAHASTRINLVAVLRAD